MLREGGRQLGSASVVHADEQQLGDGPGGASLGLRRRLQLFLSVTSDEDRQVVLTVEMGLEQC